MKILFENCTLPLSGGACFAVEGEFFVPARPPYDRRVDLGGACVLPAFPDAHSHILAYALSLLQADGGACRTAQDFLAAAETFAREQGLEPDELVTVKNARVLPEQGALDAARPIHVQHASGHAGVFNAAALRLLGLPADMGIAQEKTYLAATKRVPMPAFEAVGRAFRAAQRAYLAHGMTTAQEGFLSREMFPLYRRLLAEAPPLPDIVAYPSPDGYDEACRLFCAAPRFCIGGVKIFLDGSPQLKTALLREPYEGGGMGAQEMTPAQVYEACRFAAARGAQLLAHCNGDGAARILLGALARLCAKERRAIRPVLIHAQILGDDQLDEIARLGAIPSFFPAHVLHWGDTHLKNLGRMRAQRISPARSALERGIPFTLHQDTPVCAPDPLEGARCAVQRRTASGEDFSCQAIGAREALIALTQNAAAQYGDARKGRIAPGCRADFVVMEGGPLDDLNSARVAATWLRGAPVYERTAQPRRP